MIIAARDGPGGTPKPARSICVNRPCLVARSHRSALWATQIRSQDGMALQSVAYRVPSAAAIAVTPGHAYSHTPSKRTFDVRKNIPQLFLGHRSSDLIN
jgi:hypothetical protein